MNGETEEDITIWPFYTKTEGEWKKIRYRLCCFLSGLWKPGTRKLYRRMENCFKKENGERGQLLLSLSAMGELVLPSDKKYI